MGKGAGHVERGIMAAFKAEPNNAFTVAELARRIYRVDPVKKHRVAILRTAERLLQREGWLAIWWQSEIRGVPHVLFDRYDVMSYATARLKGQGHNEQEIHEILGKGGEYRKRVIRQGAWWWHVQHWKAERDGDKEMLAKAIAFNESVKARLSWR
jgi:hypothetical protein